ncbi:MAG: peptidylprolyl isomerase, partial [Firmicutes bacterium]|nr:peptidylprolyl isomerase [Bacillota bacterium]
QPGDVTSIASDTGYYVVFFLSREDNHYNLRMARHILFKATASADGTFTDDAKSAAQAQAQSMLDQWKAGDATEDSFAALANANSQDPGSNTNGGLYDQIYKGEMASKFDAWVFDPGRQPGDTGIVYVEGGSSTNSYAGYSVIYYVGESDMLYSTLLATNAMQSNSYNDWMTGQSDGVTTVTHSLPMFFSK